MKRPSPLTLAWQVARSEGWRAVRDRFLDRLAARRRRRSFRPVAIDAAELGAVAVPVLNLLPTAPRLDFGGVQTQFLARFEAELAERPGAVLHPEAGGYRLEVDAGGRRFALAFDAPPPGPLDLADAAFERVVRRAVELTGARLLHVEQPLGLPLASLAELRAGGLPLVLSVHDFGLFCPRPHLLERPALRFCGYCRDDVRCAACLRHDWPVAADFQPRRRALAAALLRAADAVVYPSAFLRRAYGELVPGLEAARQEVVEPPGTAPADALPPLRRGRELRRLAYVGSVKAHKGALVFEELLERFAHARFPELRWQVLGGGDPELLHRLRRRPAVEVRGYYRSGRLPALLRRHRVDLALVLSTWPESYCLVVDECLRAGVPVLAFDLGAVGDRLRGQGGALLVDPAAGAAGVAAVLADLLAGRRTLPPPPADLPALLPDAAGAGRACNEIYCRVALAPRS